MKTVEVKTVLGANRDMVISFYNENVKEDKFYTLAWFMTRVLKSAEISWARRKNIGEKEINSILNGVIKDYPQIKRGYVSNFQKAVNYFGSEKAKMMSDCK